MGTNDFSVSLFFAFATAALVYAGWYPAAVFCFCFFLLILTTTAVHYLIQPLPRTILNAKLVDDPDLIDKIKEITGE